MEKNSSFTHLNEKDFEVVQKYSNERSGSISSSTQYKKFFVPKRLKKTFYCVISLLILGLILITIGIVRAVIYKSFYEGLSFFLLATLILIPGSFYTYQFCKAKLTSDPDRRKEIILDIPQL